MTQYLGNGPLVSYGGSHQRSDEREADRGWFQFDYVLDLAEGTEKEIHRHRLISYCRNVELNRHLG